eukprot:scaffold13582_cov22-Tisochrysis_lutea.AAC.1
MRRARALAPAIAPRRPRGGHAPLRARARYALSRRPQRPRRRVRRRVTPAGVHSPSAPHRAARPVCAARAGLRQLHATRAQALRRARLHGHATPRGAGATERRRGRRTRDVHLAPTNQRPPSHPPPARLVAAPPAPRA